MIAKPSTLITTDLIAALAGKAFAQEALSRAALASVAAAPIRSVVIDSRQAGPDSLFVALHGEHRDGHDFIPDALDRGAVAVLAERPPAGASLVLAAGHLQVFQAAQCLCLIVADSLTGLQQTAAYWRRQQRVTVVGVTGSVGKSTSKEVIAAVLSQRYRTLKSEGSYNNEIGLPLTLLRLTPAYERVVLEMGMYDIGEIAQLAEIALPRIGVVTNVGPTHLERLGTIERVAQAKSELPRALPPADQGGVAILNADDERVLAMAALTTARVFTYGLIARADLWADEVESEGLEGIRFRFHYGPETIHVRVPMLGRHSVQTALRAAAVGLVEGLSWEEILAGMRDEAAQIRLLSVLGPQGSTILDDTYNASPASCIAALNLLDELDGRKVAVLGDMYELGGFEAEGHKIVGRRARNVVDLLVAVGPLGRIIGEEALEAGLTADAVYLVETNDQAIDLLRTMVRSGDRILVKGSRGMAMEEIVAALAVTPAPVRSLRKEARP
jgi:UDP-N-acetylmuramoyl-tripeptide--D-alanyl-D-alanine ligase